MPIANAALAAMRCQQLPRRSSQQRLPLRLIGVRHSSAQRRNGARDRRQRGDGAGTTRVALTVMHRRRGVAEIGARHRSAQRLLTPGGRLVVPTSSM